MKFCITTLILQYTCFIYSYILEKIDYWYIIKLHFNVIRMKNEDLFLNIEYSIYLII